MKISKIRSVKTPEQGTKLSAGYDFFIPDDYINTRIIDGGHLKIPSGIRLIIPEGYVGIFLNKSSIGSKGILIGAQVIDADYRGEVHIDLHNTSKRTHSLAPGMKIAQLVVVPYYSEDVILIDNHSYDLDKTSRGSGGFGSTGDR